MSKWQGISRRWLIAPAAVALLALGCWLVLRHKPAVAPVLSSGYVDSQTCVGCHRDEAAGYSETGMAHAFSPPNAGPTIPGNGTPRDFYHQASSTWYRVAARDGRFFQRRWQKGFDGREDNVEELSIDFVMGSGNHARTYLHREEDGTLVELPLAWYSEHGGEWAMNPGFDNATPGTRRAIAYECMFCHNAYPQIPDPAHRDLSARPVYGAAMPLGIDCQRCHGPGAAHVRAAQTPHTPPATVRAAILNPAHLSNERQMDVCEQCHLETTSTLLPDRVRHYDQQPFGYDPNQFLSAFNAYFARDPAHGPANNFEIVNSAYRLRQSKCFLASKGALTCETCHNPHDLHKGPQSAVYFANICLSCHRDTLRTLVASRQHTDSNQCVTCHMPQRRTEDVIHVVMTDHLIQRHAPSASEALAPRREATARYEGPVLRYRRGGEAPREVDALYDAVAQVIDKSNTVQGVPALAALLEQKKPKEPGFYIELGDGQKQNGNTDAATASYRKALELDPQSSRAGRRLGVILGESGQTDEALRVLNTALAHDAENEMLLYERAQVEAKAGDISSAAGDLRRVLAIKPDQPDALNNLGTLLAQSGDSAGAETQFRAALAVNPYDSGARANLGRLLGSKGEQAEALFEFQKAVELAPQSATVRVDYAIALVQANRAAQAEQEIRAALKADPESAKALDLMGQLYLEKKQPAQARVQFEAAVQADPQFAPAWLDLAETLIELGDSKAALPWLTRAQTASSPAIARRATELLRQFP